MRYKGKEELEQAIENRTLKYMPFRFVVAILITIAKILALVFLTAFLCVKVKYFYILVVLITILCALQIITSDANPDYKAPWLLFVIALPILGFTLYVWLYSRKLKRRYVKRLRDIKKTNYKKDHTELFSKLHKENKNVYGQAKMLCDLADTHLFTKVKLTYFKGGKEMMQSLIEDLKGAEKFIFLEFFIIECGVFWNSILDILEEKVKAGVEVKVVYDDIGCMRKLPGDYARYLKRFYGIDAIPFSSMKGDLNSEFNNRSHRKLVIIDGYIGYTGGVNVADEYIGEVKPFGEWKDSGLRLEGEAVWEFTELFLTDYGISVRKLPQIRKDLYPQYICEESEGYIVPFGDGPTPLYKRRVTKSTIQNMLETATDYCWIMTPYLIPDSDLCISMENAALRGVDVRIITPGIPDKKIVYGITRSYYHRLMQAGVKIFEYTPGFVHSKLYVADDELAMVSTSNMDYRSLAHNFENSVWMYKTEVIKDIKEDFLKTFEVCKEVENKDLKLNPIMVLVTALIKIFAPLM